MKSIMISIKPIMVEKILNGEKTIEIRKNKPSCELPCKVYIYCTNSGRPLVYGQENACVEEHYTRTYGYSKKEADKIWGVLNGKVVAEFTLNKVEEYELELWDNNTYESIGKVYYDEEYGEREVDILETNCEIEDTKLVKESCLNLPQLRKYLGQGISSCYAWHIDNLKIYDKPKELSEFYKNNYKKIIDELEFNGCDEKHCKFAVGNSFIGDDGYCDYSMCPKLKLTKPPQSWCYVEEMKSE